MMNMLRSMVSKIPVNRLYSDAAGNFSKMAVLNTGFTAWSGIDTYNESRNEGSGVVSSALSAGGEMVLMNAVGIVPYMLASFAPAIGRGAVDAYDSISAYSRKLQRERRNIPFQNATFVDSQQTYTMRQAGMNLIRQGQYAAQQTSLGNEASSVAFRMQR